MLDTTEIGPALTWLWAQPKMTPPGQLPLHDCLTHVRDMLDELHVSVCKTEACGEEVRAEGCYENSRSV